MSLKSKLRDLLANADEEQPDANVDLHVELKAILEDEETSGPLTADEFYLAAHDLCDSSEAACEAQYGDRDVGCSRAKGHSGLHCARTVDQAHGFDQPVAVWVDLNHDDEPIFPKVRD